jgi:tetratricopeptide (TPR) repeat protein
MSQSGAELRQPGAVHPGDAGISQAGQGVTVSSGKRARKPLPGQLTVPQRDFYLELRRLLDLAGFSSRMLGRPASAGSLGGYSRSQWDRWLNGEARPPVQAVRSLAQLIGSDGIEAGHLPDLWARAFAAGPAPRPGEAAPPGPCQLPQAVAHFTGRAAELAALTDLARQEAGAGGAVVITTIGGTAGVGKTALAVHWAHQIAGWFPDGQLYANLRGWDPAGPPAEPAEALQGFLEALGIPAAQLPAGMQARAGLYRSLLAGRRMLIVLDNAYDPSQVRPLLPGTAGSLVLVTSRSQLTGLAAADGARLLTLDVLDDGDARSLLIRRLGARRTSAEPEAVSDLIRLCERLPLALNIVAARAVAQPALPLANLAAGLHGQGRLDALDTGEPASSVRAVFSWSYRSLGDAVARMFRLLGLHPGPDITAAAAASLAGIGADQSRRHLADLAAAHLLAERIPGRYAFHDLLRAYAAEQSAACDSEPEQRAAAGRILGHYLHSAHAAATLICPGRDLLLLTEPAEGVTPEQPADTGAALAWFSAERAALSAAVTWAAGAGYGGEAWQLGWTLGRYLQRRGSRQERLAVLRTSLAAAEASADLAGQACIHRDLGTAYKEHEAGEDAERHLLRAMNLYQQLNDSVGQAHTELYLGGLCKSRALNREELDHAYRALHLFQAAGHITGQANALSNAGSSHGDLGEHEEAFACLRRALRLHRDSGNLDGEGYSWANLADTYYHLGQHKEAIDCGRRSAELFRALGNRPPLAAVLTLLGDHLCATGQSQDAGGVWEEALAILEDLQDPDASRVRAKLSQPNLAAPV